MAWYGSVSSPKAANKKGHATRALARVGGINGTNRHMADVKAIYHGGILSKTPQSDVVASDNSFTSRGYNGRAGQDYYARISGLRRSDSTVITTSPMVVQHTTVVPPASINMSTILMRAERLDISPIEYCAKIGYIPTEEQVAELCKMYA